MVDSTFRQTFDWLNNIGVLDVILPFLLIFTITFAILEKTKVFGVESVDGKTYTKKNLNSLASFAISFFAVASAQVTQAIIHISANAVILLLASVLFLTLVGSFHGESEKGFALQGPWNALFIAIMFAGLFGIFLNAIETGGKTWLQLVFDWLSQFSSNVSVASIIMIAFVVAAMFYITKAEKAPAAKT